MLEYNKNYLRIISENQSWESLLRRAYYLFVSDRHSERTSSMLESGSDRESQGFLDILQAWMGMVQFELRYCIQRTLEVFIRSDGHSLSPISSDESVG